MSSDALWPHLEAALERPVEERVAFLESRLEGEALAEAVELLSGVDSMDGWFDALGRELDGLRGAAVRRREADAEAVPRQIGPFRIIQRWGIGGMGEVYRAERADGAFEQTVAIKLIRRSLDDPVSLERFRAERQILAQLEHPSIARLIDGGVTDDGRPYLVMEWVDGEPIDRWMNRHRLDTHARIRLFLDVCDAVRFAHRKLVIHRDIKPSNILVDREGRIKLLDFGVAKILRSGAPPEPGAAETPDRVPAGVETAVSGDSGRAPLTPRYAAPEQLQGAAPTTSTDVFGLAVVLYELLSGCSPFEGNDRRLERTDSSREVVPASRRLATSEAPPPGVRARDLRGDLDAILQRALRTAPADRTASVTDLRDDLRRVLEHRPVRARPRTIRLRLDRWVRRNRTAAVVVLVAAGLLIWGGFRLLQQYRATVQERDKAQAVAGLLVELFRSVDPLQPQTQPPSADEILERGRARVALLDDQPELQASLADVLGEVHRNVGLHEDAISLHEKALAFHRSRGEDSPQTIHSLALQAEALRLGGDLERSAAVADEALTLARRRYGADHLETARLTSLLGRILLSQRDFDRAEELLEAALATQQRLQETPDLDQASTFNDLAVSHLLQGDGAAAEPLLRQAITIRSDRLGADHASIAGLQNNLAAVLSGRAQFAEAEQLYRRLLPQLTERLGATHVHTINAQRNLGLTILQQGRSAEALTHLTAALDNGAAALPENHPLLVVLTNFVGHAQFEGGDLQRAEATLERGLSMGRAAFGSGDPRLASVENNVGLLHERRGDFDRAEGHFRRALETSRAQLGDDHPQVLTIQSNLARIEVSRGDFVSAEARYARTLPRQREVLPPGHPDLAYTLLGYARCLLFAGDRVRARSLTEEALALRRAILPPDHRLTREASSFLDELAS